MAVFYDGKKLTPAPFVSIQKQFQTTEDGTNIGVIFNITVSGTIVAYKGSPQGGTLSGSEWGGPRGRFWISSGYPPDETITQDQRLRNILRKQESIRELFATPGLSFEVQPWDGSAPIKCNPRVKSINFPEGLWVEICPYTIELETDVLYISGTVSSESVFTNANNENVYISSANEDWTIEFAEQDRTDLFRLTHTVSAVGKRFYDENGALVSEAWETARDYVIPLLGIDTNRITSPEVLSLTGYTGYNHVRSENINELNGSYAVTESWLVHNNTAVEEFSVSTKTTVEDGRTVVTVDGVVRGMEQRDTNFDVSVSKYTNAAAYFVTVQNLILTRAQSYSGITVNAIPADKTILRNEIQGFIQYNYSFDNRPTPFLPGALKEEINVTDQHPTNIFAAIPVLGRQAGPVLQDINTFSERRRSISINAIFPATGALTPALSLALKPNSDSVIASLVPAGSQVFKSTDTESWSWAVASYSRNVEYVWEA